MGEGSVGKVRLFRPDAWTGTHLFGSFFLSCLCQHFIPSHLEAACLAFSFGLLWECMDEGFGKTWAIFDPRGMDLGDAIADGIGAFAAIWI